MSAGSLKDVLDRLFGLDANDRVKAANEIGEIGTEAEAPIVLKVAYEDDASTVRQMAIQSYYEIMGEHGFEEIKKAAVEHDDQYVRIYAINLLGKMPSHLVADLLITLYSDEDPRIRATSVKSMIYSQSKQNATFLLENVENEDHKLTLCNIVEAWALWRYDDAKEAIGKLYDISKTKEKSIELTTISSLALASFGDGNALKALQEEEIDQYYRIKIRSRHYRGRNGLLDAITELKQL